MATASDGGAVRSEGTDADGGPDVPVDMDAIQTWIYPTNYPIREYQRHMAWQALHANTLVSLPTGLGKTLIAAVVMYNFYRWFPTGKVVFVAPTKPLVSQQVSACYNVMGIPEGDTAELQGSVQPAERERLWRERRVFFCTPQSMANDINHKRCDASRFVCLVIDEAHRATGNYAYTMLVQKLWSATKRFRVLALSATPGGDLKTIQHVLDNLKIARIECRFEDDPEVARYTHARPVVVVQCKLGEHVQAAKNLLEKLMVPIASKLAGRRLLYSKSSEGLGHWAVQLALQKFRAEQGNGMTPGLRYDTEAEFSTLARLAHANESLTAHGASAAFGKLRDMEEHLRRRSSRPLAEVVMSSAWKDLMRLMDASNEVGNAQQQASRRHPKLLKLKDVLVEHFRQHEEKGTSTRAIVFTQLRESVEEIVTFLSDEPLLRVRAFVGQGNGARPSATNGKTGGASGGPKGALKGQSQKEQKAIVAAFFAGQFNCLAATCIAEEGLDIGEVDLIVSFDALSSPIRMVQRMGRTGRKREGRVVVLVTEGAEEAKLRNSDTRAKTVARALRQQRDKFTFCHDSARMIPPGVKTAMVQKKMVIPEHRLSQVGGHRGSARRGTGGSTGTGGANAAAGSSLLEEGNWRLAAAELSAAREGYGSGSYKPDPAHGWRRQKDKWTTGVVKHGSRFTLLQDIASFVSDAGWEMMYPESLGNAAADANGDADVCKGPTRKRSGGSDNAKLAGGGGGSMSIEAAFRRSNAYKADAGEGSRITPPRTDFRDRDSDDAFASATASQQNPGPKREGRAAEGPAAAAANSSAGAALLSSSATTGRPRKSSSGLDTSEESPFASRWRCGCGAYIAADREKCSVCGGIRPASAADGAAAATGAPSPSASICEVSMPDRKLCIDLTEDAQWRKVEPAKLELLTLLSSDQKTTNTEELRDAGPPGDHAALSALPHATGALLPLIACPEQLEKSSVDSSSNSDCSKIGGAEGKTQAAAAVAAAAAGGANSLLVADAMPVLESVTASAGASIAVSGAALDELFPAMDTFIPRLHPLKGAPATDSSSRLHLRGPPRGNGPTLLLRAPVLPFVPRRAPLTGETRLLQKEFAGVSDLERGQPMSVGAQSKAFQHLSPDPAEVLLQPTPPETMGNIISGTAGVCNGNTVKPLVDVDAEAFAKAPAGLGATTCSTKACRRGADDCIRRQNLRGGTVAAAAVATASKPAADSGGELENDSKQRLQPPASPQAACSETKGIGKRARSSPSKPQPASSAPAALAAVENSSRSCGGGRRIGAVEQQCSVAARLEVGMGPVDSGSTELKKASGAGIICLDEHGRGGSSHTVPTGSLTSKAAKATHGQGSCGSKQRDQRGGRSTGGCGGSSGGNGGGSNGGERRPLGGAAEANVIDEDATCSACGGSESWEDDPILLCDGTECTVTVHQGCYGVATVPEGDWFCDACQAAPAERRKPGAGPNCCLCNHRGSAAMKRSSDGQWCHLVCVIWTPELYLEEGECEPAGLDDLDRGRRHLTCAVCLGKGGAAVQCAEQRCHMAAHPFCARDADWLLLSSANGSRDADDDHFALWCRKHAVRRQRQEARLRLNEQGCDDIGTHREATGMTDDDVQGESANAEGESPAVSRCAGARARKRNFVVLDSTQSPPAAPVAVGARAAAEPSAIAAAASKSMAPPKDRDSVSPWHSSTQRPPCVHKGSESGSQNAGRSVSGRSSSAIGRLPVSLSALSQAQSPSNTIAQQQQQRKRLRRGARQEEEGKENNAERNVNAKEQAATRAKQLGGNADKRTWAVRRYIEHEAEVSDEDASDDDEALLDAFYGENSQDNFIDDGCLSDVGTHTQSQNSRRASLTQAAQSTLTPSRGRKRERHASSGAESARASRGKKSRTGEDSAGFHRRLHARLIGDSPEAPLLGPRSGGGPARLSFISAVIAHHRAGGRPEDIETAICASASQQTGGADPDSPIFGDALDHYNETQTGFTQYEPILPGVIRCTEEGSTSGVGAIRYRKADLPMASWAAHVDADAGQSSGAVDCPAIGNTRAKRASHLHGTAMAPTADSSGAQRLPAAASTTSARAAGARATEPVGSLLGDGGTNPYARSASATGATQSNVPALVSAVQVHAAVLRSGSQQALPQAHAAPCSAPLLAQQPVVHMGPTPAQQSVPQCAQSRSTQAPQPQQVRMGTQAFSRAMQPPRKIAAAVAAAGLPFTDPCMRYTGATAAAAGAMGRAASSERERGSEGRHTSDLPGATVAAAALAAASSLTQEQRRRIEESRRRALELRNKRSSGRARLDDH